MSNLQLYFSDFFRIEKSIVDSYGAVDISLINDLPLFVDPFLLFNSDQEDYQKIHNEIIRYIIFLQNKTEKLNAPSKGLLSSWYNFSEIKQTWLGFSLKGNSGRGLGMKFARHLYEALLDSFKDFGNEDITKSPHLEKLCLISPFVGRDKISDFATNFAKKYLLEYTAQFASKYIDISLCRKIMVPRVSFNYETETWYAKEFILPFYHDDYVLLTPKNMLTRDNTFLNREDMITNLDSIAPSIEDASLRFELNNYLVNQLEKNKKISKTEKNQLAEQLIRKHPLLIDYYIRHKEENAAEATSISEKAVAETTQLFNNQLPRLVVPLQKYTSFYQIEPDSYQATHERIAFLKSVIEDMDGYRIFYLDGKPIKRESDLQIMFRLAWFATEYDVNREVNNGRGPVDYKVSRGSHDSVLVEFKLASNTKLKMNLKNQVEIYKKSNNTSNAIKVILYFTLKEYERVLSILKDLKLENDPDIVLIDATNNKPSASTVKY